MCQVRCGIARLQRSDGLHAIVSQQPCHTPKIGAHACRCPVPAASEEEDWKSGSSDCTAVEMAQLLYWLLIVGYQLRTLEVRLDMRSQLELPPPSLPPGR